MKEMPKTTVKRKKVETAAASAEGGEGQHHPSANDGFNTEGLPPNAVDEDGNILVTDFDIL